MTRIAVPDSIENSPVGSQPLLESIKNELGSLPNFYRLVATSPAVLEGCLGLDSALDKGSLDPATRERIAIAVAEINGCNYCLAAHSFVGKNLLRLSDEEIASNRKGHSTDARAEAAVVFAAKVAKARGAISENDLATVIAAGYSDAELLEIVAHVASNTLSNYINEVFKTDVDFPAAPKLA